MCVFRNTHVYARSTSWSANPRPLGAPLNGLPSQHRCVFVPTAAIGLPKLLDVLDLRLASSEDHSATHMCVFTAAIGWPSPQLSSYAVHVNTRVYARSSNWSANPRPLVATFN